MHLKAQLGMSKALVRLLNAGLPIWMTTHSDTIFQYMNNMIKLNKQPAMISELGYETKDVLHPRSVTAYQFVIQANGETLIEKLPLTNEGFSVPTFNETILRLAQETLTLQEHDDVNA